jgi:DNA polymerase-3 subunit beta
VGTDGKRLALVSRKVEDLVQGGDFDIAEEGVIIPRIVFSELNKYQFQDDVLGIGFSSNQIFFRYENVRLTSNLIEGKYPDYKKIIPGERESFLLTDRELLLNAIKRVAVLVDESYNQVKLSIMENRLVLSTQNPALGGAVEEIPIEYGGDQIDIALNFTYLVDCLKEIDSEGTKIDFENEERVVTVHGIGEQGYVNLIMPMKLNG